MTGPIEASTWIVVPTYWGPREGSPFDHPTPLDGQSTLPRLLESLARQTEPPPFGVLILLATSEPDVVSQASQRLVEIVEPYQQAYPLALADGRALEAVSEAFKASHLDPTGIDLASYAGIRNLQLLIPACLGAELIVALDDDEVVPPMHLSRAHQTTRRLAERNASFGLAGPYLDAGGSPFLPETPEPAHLFEAKSALINQAIRGLIEDDDPYPQTPLALGGNMVFPRALFSQVGFDPSITRGEDIDYLINARVAGFDFHFDKVLAIKHLPPRHYEASAYAKLRHDVYRFVYQREKLRLAGLAAEEFDPYPGQMLREGIGAHARRALEAEAASEQVSIWGTPQTILAQAKEYAAKYAPKYFDLADRWPGMIEAVHVPAASEVIRKSLLT